MNFLRYLILLGLTAVFSTPLFAQELPEGFIYDKRGELVFQVGPEEAFAVKAAGEDGNYLAVAIGAGMIENKYYVALFSTHSKKSGDVFKEQKDLPVTLTVDGEKIPLNNSRNIYEKKVSKTKIEIMLIWISMEEFEKIIAARKVFIEFGKIEHLLSAENLQAFRYLSKQMESDEDLRAAAATVPGGSNTIQVKGYYRKDGTYVRPHTRKRP